MLRSIGQVWADSVATPFLALTSCNRSGSFVDAHTVLAFSGVTGSSLTNSVDEKESGIKLLSRFLGRDSYEPSVNFLKKIDRNLSVLL